jgi:hypothetical protein
VAFSYTTSWDVAVEGDLLHLQERLNRDVARSRYARQPLILTAVGVLGTRPDPNTPLENRRMVRWVLTNQTWPDGPGGEPTVVRSFQLEGQWVDVPQVWALGSVQNRVLRSPSEIPLFKRSLNHRPNKPADYLGLLAAINRRAAPSSKQTVSPWCAGTFMPEIGQELANREFSKRGDPEPPSPAGIPAIIFGLDTTDLTRQMQLAMRNHERGLPPPPAVEPDRSLEGRP